MERELGDAVAAPGALLWLVHALLRDAGWLVLDSAASPSSLASSSAAAPGRGSDARGFSGDVNLLPQVVFRVGASAEVAVRALSAGDSLFVHFVAADKSLRLPLRVAEYVKKANGGPVEQGDRRERIGGWLCNRETLMWRLERNVLPEFPAGDGDEGADAAPAVTQDAELSRLSDALLRRVGCFLRGNEFVRLAEASKGLHRLHDDSELWINMVRAEFPGVSVGATDHPKTLYISRWRHRQTRQPPPLWWSHRADPLPGWRDDRFGPPRGPFSWVPPTMRPPHLLPPRPPNWPFYDDQVGPFGYTDTGADDEIWPVFDPRYSWLQLG